MNDTTTKQLVWHEILEAAPVRESYERGATDYLLGVYNPPSNETPEWADYIKGWNDAWAKANKRTILR